MKLRNLAGALMAFASVTLALPFTAAADSQGDIFEFLPVLNGGRNPHSPLPDEQPLRAYDKFQFRLRLLSTDWQDPESGRPSDWNIKWSPVATLNWPSIGIIVGGRLREARYVSRKTYDADAQSAFTDFIFEYQVEPGDFAFPTKLAAAGSEVWNPIPAGQNATVEYCLINGSDWCVTNGLGQVAKMVHCSNGTVSQVLSGRYKRPEGGDRVTDFDLSQAGFYVQTVDFDSTEYAKDVWRGVEEGDTGCEPEPGYVVTLDGNAVTNAISLYAWCSNETAVAGGGTAADGV